MKKSIRVLVAVIMAMALVANTFAIDAEHLEEGTNPLARGNFGDIDGISDEIEPYDDGVVLGGEDGFIGIVGISDEIDLGDDDVLGGDDGYVGIVAIGDDLDLGDGDEIVPYGAEGIEGDEGFIGIEPIMGDVGGIEPRLGGTEDEKAGGNNGVIIAIAAAAAAAVGAGTVVTLRKRAKSK